MQSDAELIVRSLAGDGEAFVEVICRHEAAVGAYLARRAGRGAAEDLLGDVWVAAYESRGAYDRAFADARPWLFGVALNRLRRYWRSRPSAEEPVPDLAGYEAGGGNPQIRIGVLRLLSTVPEVTVRNSTTGGQPTLTLTASKALFANITQDVLTINASTGIPISSVSNVPGQPPSSVVTYQVSRVTVADIAAGKF